MPPAGASSLNRAEVGVCFLHLVLQTQATLGPAMAEHSASNEEALSRPWRGFFVAASECYCLIEAPAWYCV